MSRNAACPRSPCNHTVTAPTLRPVTWTLGKKLAWRPPPPPPPGTAGAVWTRCARCRPGYFTFCLSGCEGSAAPGPGRVRPFLAPRALPRGRRPLPVCQLCLGRPCVCSRVQGAGPTACQHTGQGPPVGDGHDGLKRQPPARRLGTRLSSMRHRLGHRFEPCHWRLASVFDKAR